jgi:hypothetical protein
MNVVSVSNLEKELELKPTIRKTENVLLAAFLRYKGIKQVYVKKIKRGKGLFYFDLPQEEWDKIVSEYDNSPELRFEHCRVDTINLTYT